MNIRKMLVVALTTMYCTITNIFCIDFRRHIFQLDNGNFYVEDEGFRWRSSFNFNINLGNGPVAVANWFFRNEAGFVVHEKQEMVYM